MQHVREIVIFNIKEISNGPKFWSFSAYFAEINVAVLKCRLFRFLITLFVSYLAEGCGIDSNDSRAQLAHTVVVFVIIKNLLSKTKQISRWWFNIFFTAQATGLKLQLSHYPVSLLSQYMMRREFVWPPQGSTKDWIQCGTPRGQAGGGPSWGAPASHHLHTADRPVSLDMNSPPPPPLTSANPPSSSILCSDKSHLHPGHILLPLPISASDLSVNLPEFYVTATLWPQLRTLLSFCYWADFGMPRW